MPPTSGNIGGTTSAAMMADPLRAQSAIDRLQNAAYELAVEGESYRKRQRPSLTNLTGGDAG